MDADALLSQQSSHKSKGRPVLRRGPQRPFAPSSSKKKKRLCSLSFSVVTPPPILVCLSLLTPSDNHGGHGAIKCPACVCQDF